jgi:hypothetical protein
LPGTLDGPAVAEHGLSAPDDRPPECAGGHLTRAYRKERHGPTSSAGNGLAALTTLTIDGGAGDDTLTDIVIANGTAGPDKVHVGTLEGNVLVSGLPAALQISGSEGANDGLQINTVGGKDSVAIASGVGQLINPSVDLGADQ